jgi:hypothetical protein
MARIFRNRIVIEQELILETDSDEAVSSDSENEHNEDTMAAEGDNNVTRSRDNIWSKSQHPRNSDAVHPFIGAFSGLKIQEAPHVNKDSSPITFFCLFFMDVMLVADTNKYYNQYLGTLDNDDGC